MRSIPVYKLKKRTSENDFDVPKYEINVEKCDEPSVFELIEQLTPIFKKYGHMINK